MFRPKFSALLMKVVFFSLGRRRVSRGGDFLSVVRFVLVEIGPEGWTPTQQRPDLSLPQLTTAKGATTTYTKKGNVET
jgi:hypothetical protein